MTPRSRRSARGGAIFKVIVVMLVLAATLTLAWMLLLPWGVASTLERRSGFPTQIGRLAFNPGSGAFSGGDLRIDNPVAMGGGPFVNIAAFGGRARMGTLTESEFVIEELSIDLAELVIIVDAQGRTNAAAFGEALARAAAAPDRQPGYAVAGFPLVGEGPQSVLIERLHLKIGRVELVQPDPRFPPRMGEQLGFEGTFENVRRWQDLITPELLQQLARSPGLWRALQSSGVLPTELGDPGRLQQLLRRAGDALNSLFRTLEQ